MSAQTGLPVDSDSV